MQGQYTELDKRQAKVAKEWLYQQCCRVQLVLLLVSGAARVQGRKQERSDAGTQPSCGCVTTAHGYAEGSVQEGLHEKGIARGKELPIGEGHTARQGTRETERSSLACRLQSEDSCQRSQGLGQVALCGCCCLTHNRLGAPLLAA